MKDYKMISQALFQIGQKGQRSALEMEVLAGAAKLAEDLASLRENHNGHNMESDMVIYAKIIQAERTWESMERMLFAMGVEI